MTTTMMYGRTAQTAGAVALALVIPAIFWIAQGPESALIAFAWAAAVLLAFRIGGGRSGVGDIVRNAGDERVQTLHTKALAFAGFAMWAVITGWWLVSAAAGNENETVGILGATFAVAFLGASFFLSRRG